jgi:acylphosphatase
MKRVEITVQGRVQGVFFRVFIEKHAAQLGLKGYVKNTGSDGVEIVAEGKYEDLQKLAEAAAKGPMMARVLKHNVNYSDATGEFGSFEITY